MGDLLSIFNSFLWKLWRLVLSNKSDRENNMNSCEIFLITLSHTRYKFMLWPIFPTTTFTKPCFLTSWKFKVWLTLEDVCAVLFSVFLWIIACSHVKTLNYKTLRSIYFTDNMYVHNLKDKYIPWNRDILLILKKAPRRDPCKAYFEKTSTAFKP